EADLGENIGDGLLRGVVKARTEAPDGSLVREGGFRTEIGDGKRLLKDQGAGHDLAVNGPQRFVGDRACIQLADALKHGQFPVRGVDFLSRLELEDRKSTR